MGKEVTYITKTVRLGIRATYILIVSHLHSPSESKALEHTVQSGELPHIFIKA